MNKFCIALSLGLGSRLVAADPIQQIVHAALDARTVFKLPVASDRITTVIFPGPISGLEAAFVTLDGEPPARFQCSFLPGQKYFSLRALQPNSTANINVVWNGNVYVFEVCHSQDPTYAVILSPPLRQQSPAANGPGQPGTPAGPALTPLATNAATRVVIPTGTRPDPARLTTNAAVTPQSQAAGTAPPTVYRPSYVITPDPAPGPSTTTTRIMETTTEEKKRRWWKRWSIPYLINFEINTSKD